jgi:hypothetical protein
MYRLRGFLIILVTLVLGACLDMDVTNPNNPDLRSVQNSPADLETLVATSFLTFYNRAQQNSAALTASTISGSFSGGFGCFGVLERSAEPRVPITTVQGAGNQSHALPWADYYSAIAQVNTGLRAIDEGNVTIREGGADVTPRARAFAKFVQGVSHAYAALSFDRGYVFSESVASDTLRFTGGAQDVQELLRPYAEVADTALAQLDAAIAIIQQSNVSLPNQTPERWISGNSFSPAEFVQLIRLYQARLIAYLPRSREEKAAADWSRVVNLLDQARTTTFAPVGSPDIIEHNFQRLTARQRSTVPSDHVRPSYYTLGYADQSGGFQNWLNTPWSNRTPFVMTVQDLRIIDPNREKIVSQAQAEGAYFGQHIANVWAAERGTGRRTYYYFHRWGRGNSWQTEPLVTIAEAEIDLLRAEAYLWLGQPELAIPLINKSRVGNGGLAPVTLAGAPADANGHCTPRKNNGDCGSLWDALRYEKSIETLGTEGYISWWDRRGWQGLIEGTEVHWPMPLEDQELLQIPVYSAGGGQPGSAPAWDAERCPAAIASLPGCS